jgi:hypothetical protein
MLQRSAKGVTPSNAESLIFDDASPKFKLDANSTLPAGATFCTHQLQFSMGHLLVSIAPPRFTPLVLNAAKQLTCSTATPCTLRGVYPYSRRIPRPASLISVLHLPGSAAVLPSMLDLTIRGLIR